MQLDPDAPAYPQQITIPGGSWNPIRCRRVPTGETDVEVMPGLTIRAEIASRAMQAIMQATGSSESCSDLPWKKEGKTHQQWCAVCAVQYADALIAALNQPKP